MHRYAKIVSMKNIRPYITEIPHNSTKGDSMSNWLKRVFARVTGRSTENKDLSGNWNNAANNNRKSTSGSASRTVAKRRTTSPGYGSSSRSSSSSSDTYVYTSPSWYSSGDSGSYGGSSDGGSCGGGDGGGGGCGGGD